MKGVALGSATLLALVVAAQLVLPGVAERRLREELADTGQVRSVDVGAFPALKLLFGRADSVRIRLRETRLGVEGLADKLDRASAAGELDARADTLRVGPLTLRDLTLRKRGDRLSGAAAVNDRELLDALPVQFGLRPVEAGSGQLVLEARAGGLAVRARLSARDGALVIAPDGLLGGFSSLTVFEDPRVAVTGVGARARPDGFTLTAEARLA